MTVELKDQSTFFELLKSFDKNKETYKKLQLQLGVTCALEKYNFERVTYTEESDEKYFTVYHNSVLHKVLSPFFYEECE